MRVNSLLSPYSLQRTISHTAHPTSIGTHTRPFSTCGVAGYAMESRHHIGNITEYHTVTELSWAVRLTNHPLATVIDSTIKAMARWGETRP